MTHKYQNVAFSGQRSAFADINQTNPLQATFDAREVHVAVKNGSVDMVRGHVLLQEPFQATVCGETCGTTLTRSLKLEFNVEKGGASISALRVELLRLFDEAVEDYGLAVGYVPPAYANFAQA